MYRNREQEMNTQQQTTSVPTFEAYDGTAPENYERFFVPAIGEPMARDLLDVAALTRGERVLDIACGTGIVARLAAERVGSRGTVVGLDINSGMLEVANQSTPTRVGIEWRQGRAESLPFPDSTFDVLLCQLGFQFFAEKLASLREMGRVLAPGGRLFLTVPGPAPTLFVMMEEALANHISPDVSRFVDHVFSVHDVEELRDLLKRAGLRNIEVVASMLRLRLPAPADFLWQYVYSTPLAAALEATTPERRTTLERDVVAKWQAFVDGDAMALDVRVLTASARTD
jgi:ubiquinone/menaquinone biosynthesis C-methylase UbiE